MSYSQSLGQGISALEIMERVKKVQKPTSSITEISLEIIRIKRGKEKVKIREFTRFQKNYKIGKFKSKSLVRFKKPLMVKGTGLLSWIYRSGKTDQWIFLPKLKTAKKIKAKERSKSFMGTDFIYEDFESRTLDSDSLSLIGIEYVDGQQSQVIMAWPKNSSAYFKRKIWVNTKNWQIIKIEFYSSESQIEKTLTVSKFVLENGYISPGKMLMAKENGNKTIMKFSAFKPDVGLKDNIFSESFLVKF
ncbi:MAG: outer membrane lipoprotein-sorting protein [Candidatus Marinimicrobia bacterium]|jgi:outer membrane lipoprotein-sorting protein|nr:outer membrane lipoprotein-sorting protein [Candidatus Neomarinimicrobiota bacterium]MBT3502027.1 outer membrane lipoprotein-sorting protein [Candidatus Neomarinimicrobiota bacterium]MBT3839137.1 outer membrane lipoprotein-sorting protein [Candidatus Neomarinimicrobiota bacterium]MBT3998977.1 outer membrane lipoprotein-sorting protein [Candidatus Neomarinimicrobiota bacterium]MBT4283451.1 outer membrane lipoprotein-sorting protein [Candidatus Neomarinimicrobiota bacterium]